MILTQEDMCRMSEGYETALGDPSFADAFFSSSYDAHWTQLNECSAELIKELANKAGFNTPQEAMNWMKEEIQMHLEDGNLGVAEMYQELITTGIDIEESVIVGQGEKDGSYLWDGTHRIAAAYARNITLPAIIGKKK